MNTKKIVSIILAAVMMMCAFTACGEKSDIPTGYKLASNEVCDFDFIVPITWTVSLSDGTVAAYCSPSDPSSISVMPGELQHADSTVADWWTENLTDFQSVYDEFTVIGEKDATLGGVAGKEYTCTAKLGENSYRFEITAVVLRSRLYMMTFTSTDALYEDHATVLETIKEHFTFK